VLVEVEFLEPLPGEPAGFLVEPGGEFVLQIGPGAFGLGLVGGTGRAALSLPRRGVDPLEAQVAVRAVAAGQQVDPDSLAHPNPSGMGEWE
jgi:hypothetical protein